MEWPPIETVDRWVGVVGFLGLPLVIAAIPSLDRWLARRRDRRGS